ncbi:pilus assembly PilX family protein [Herminiimonas arsenitoxidans]|uniref:pilus assembly PilX family protein n=1 Tax=Herminiimonas arsenitoxidans TaxID=1809410 RepID=UPI0009704790|nr:hypothetical protein [Herminiimonas arsenitoxidans]
MSSSRFFIPRAKQAGVVLIIALVVLVAMTLAGIALMRSVDTSNLIAGNLAFQQAATNSGDAGVEAAVSWLQAANVGSTLSSDDVTQGYAANGGDATQNPTAGQSWDAYWTQSLTARKVDLNGGEADVGGNKVSYVIDRMCNLGGAKAVAFCTSSPVVTAATGNDQGPGVQPNAGSTVYYRITVRIAGPRNTVSYVQTMVSM